MMNLYQFIYQLSNLDLVTDGEAEYIKLVEP